MRKIIQRIDLKTYLAALIGLWGGALLSGCAPSDAVLNTEPLPPASRYAIKLITDDGHAGYDIDYYCDSYELLSNYIIIKDKVTHKQVILYGASVAIEER